jgi:hypothetical protein
MSTIYFRTEHEGIAEVRGCERAYGAFLTKSIGASALYGEPFPGDTDPVARYFPADWRASLPPHWSYEKKLAFYLDGGFKGDRILQIGDKAISGMSLLANTAMRLGSDAVKLMVRLHLSCEVHTWVDGPNRLWLAEIIEAGRKSGVLRPNMGWEGVAKLLRQRDDQPVVTRYSVTDGFPNWNVAEWQPPEGFEGEPHEAWGELPEEEQWRLCLSKLREREAAEPDGIWLELKPSNWNAYHYGPDLTILDLNDREFQERLAQRKEKA